MVTIEAENPRQNDVRFFSNSPLIFAILLEITLFIFCLNWSPMKTQTQYPVCEERQQWTTIQYRSLLLLFL